MSERSSTAGGEDFESTGSARDDQLADSLGIDGAADRHDEPADDLPTAASPQPRPDRLPRRADPDLARLDAAQRGFDPNDSAAIAAAAAGAQDAQSGQSRGWLAARRAARAGRPRRKSPWWELPVLVAVAIAIAIVVKTFVVQPFYIPSASMEKTLYGATNGGDRILVNKPIYDFRDPHPGDIVVFNAPPGWSDGPGTTPPANPILKAVRGFGQLIGFVPPDGLVLVKRVIAVGGQTVKGIAVNGGTGDRVMISDHGAAGPWRTLVEPYVYLDRPDPTANFGPVTVPKGRLWVMGDHRNDSADSRYHCGPGGTNGLDGPQCNPVASTVPIQDVIGKAFVIAWPPARWRTLGTPSTFQVGAQALAAALPLLGSALLVTPLLVARRRRRRRR